MRYLIGLPFVLLCCWVTWRWLLSTADYQQRTLNRKLYDRNRSLGFWEQE